MVASYTIDPKFKSGQWAFLIEHAFQIFKIKKLNIKKKRLEMVHSCRNDHNLSFSSRNEFVSGLNFQDFEPFKVFGR